MTVALRDGYAYGSVEIYRTEDGVDYEIEVELEADLREHWATVRGALVVSDAGYGRVVELTADERERAESAFLRAAHGEASAREYDAREARRS